MLFRGFKRFEFQKRQIFEKLWILGAPWSLREHFRLRVKTHLKAQFLVNYLDSGIKRFRTDRRIILTPENGIILTYIALKWTKSTKNRIFINGTKLKMMFLQISGWKSDFWSKSKNFEKSKKFSLMTMHMQKIKYFQQL